MTTSVRFVNYDTMANIVLSDLFIFFLIHTSVLKVP